MCFLYFFKVFFKLILLAAGHWTKSVLVLRTRPKGQLFYPITFKDGGGNAGKCICSPLYPPGCVPAGEQEQDDPRVDRGGGGNGHKHLAYTYVEEEEISGMDWFGFSTGSCGKECFKVQFTAHQTIFP